MTIGVNIAEIYETLAQEREPYPALIYQEQTITNRELISTGRRLARGLSELGVKPGDRVAFLLPNSPELVAGFLAAFRIGAVAAPITVSLGKREVAHILANAEPKLCVARLDGASGAEEALLESGVPVARVDGAAVGRTPTYAELIAKPEADTAPVPCQWDDLGVLIYTSGSTGLPKGAMLTLANLIRPGGRLFDENGKRKPVPELPLMPITVLAVPTSHVYGLIILTAGFYLAQTLILVDRFQAEAVLDLIARRRPLIFPGVPTMFRYLLDSPRLRDADLSSVLLWVSGAAPLSPAIQEEWKRKTGKEIVQGYGLTETAAYVSASLLGAPSKPGSIGPPAPGVQIRIVDGEDRELPRGQVGEILIQGVSVMKGYFREARSTSEVLRDGWLHTGDLGYLDAEGYIFIVDRKKDLIIRGGFNIYPAEVEEVLRLHPAVAEAAVVGAPDPVQGEQVVAFVELRPGQSASEEELKEHARGQIAHYKAPSAIVIRDRLPRNFVGKLLRRELKEEAKQLGQRARERGKERGGHG